MARILICLYGCKILDRKTQIVTHQHWTQHSSNNNFFSSSTNHFEFKRTLIIWRSSIMPIHREAFEFSDISITFDSTWWSFLMPVCSAANRLCIPSSSIDKNIQRPIHFPAVRFHERHVVVWENRVSVIVKSMKMCVWMHCTINTTVYWHVSHAFIQLFNEGRFLKVRKTTKVPTFTFWFQMELRSCLYFSRYDWL